MTSVAKRYAQALFELILEEDQLEKFSQELTTIQQFFESSSEIRKFLNDASITPQQMQDFFQELSSCFNLSETLVRFLKVLAEQQRHSLLYEIIHISLQKIQTYQKISKACVFSAHPLTQDQRSMLVQALEKHFDRKVSLEEKVDTTLIAGIILDYEGFRIDTSLKTQLAQWQREIRI